MVQLRLDADAVEDARRIPAISRLFLPLNGKVWSLEAAMVHGLGRVEKER